MYKFGEYIRVLPGAGYDEQLSGRTGRVVNHFKTLSRIGVEFTDLKNPNSKTGVFWVPEDKTEPSPRVPCAPSALTTPITKVIHSGAKTIVFWDDGDKTIVSCGAGDEYDEYAGFCAAVTKKLFGSTSAAKRAWWRALKKEA